MSDSDTRANPSQVANSGGAHDWMTAKELETRPLFSPLLPPSLCSAPSLSLSFIPSRLLPVDALPRDASAVSLDPFILIQLVDFLSVPESPPPPPFKKIGGDRDSPLNPRLFAFLWRRRNPAEWDGEGERRRGPLFVIALHGLSLRVCCLYPSALKLLSATYTHWHPGSILICFGFQLSDLEMSH